MDKLEEHIIRNREELDRYTPSPVLWKRISKNIIKEKSPLIQWLSIAAMITIIIGTILVLFRPGGIMSDNKIAEGNFTTKTQNGSQLKETEIYYTGLANSIYLEATPLLERNPEIKRELSVDISQIDSICSEVKKDLKDILITKAMRLGFDTSKLIFIY